MVGNEQDLLHDVTKSNHRVQKNGRLFLLLSVAVNLLPASYFANVKLSYNNTGKCRGLRPLTAEARGRPHKIQGQINASEEIKFQRPNRWSGNQSAVRVDLRTSADNLSLTARVLDAPDPRSGRFGWTGLADRPPTSV